jgi:site-specific DNA-methyltransferase (adenine-specific)
MRAKAKTIKRKWWRQHPACAVLQMKDGDIVCSDALAFLSNLRPKSADLVFLDPPFNLGKRYGSGPYSKDRLRETSYFEFMKEVLLHSIRILKDGGALYLYHIPKWAMRFSQTLQQHLEFRHWIAISMKNGFVRRTYLYPAHYALLYFTKGKPRTFKRPKIPVPTCRHCANHIKDYGGYKKYVKDGINLSDIWDDLSPVRHKKYKTRSANELPMEIPRRVVQISGKKNGVLVDPFAGTGGSLIAARERGMKFVACDREEEYCTLMIKRLANSKP